LEGDNLPAVKLSRIYDSEMRYLPYKKKTVAKARELRKAMTPAERKLWYEFLCTFKHRALKQRPIDGFIADFYIAKLKLVIELDGEHHSKPEQQSYDAERTKVFEGYKLTVIRFTNHEVMKSFEGVCQTIANYKPTHIKEK
jgi:very-short-patch-repair endonuclease